MSDTMFTPGPWDAFGTLVGARGIIIRQQWECVRKSIDELQANAYLIAAAPDMYEALEAISGSGCFCSCSIGNPMTGGNHSDACKKATSALKKARGEV